MSTRSTGDADGASLEEKALSRLRQNRRAGYDPYYKTRYEYSIPSPGRYRWQWMWDSCFHAIALARLDPEMAKRELSTLLASQRADGFIGHIVYWGRRGAILSAVYMQSRFGEWRRRHSAMLQPPVLAQAVEAVYRATGDKEFLNSVLPGTIAYYRWIERERDPDGEGLFSIISPYECGLDNSPVFDAPLGLSENPGRLALLWANRRLDWHNLLRGNFQFSELRKRDRFIVIDPFMNAVYADGLRAIERLLGEVGELGQGSHTAMRAGKVEKAVIESLWDDERGQFIYLSGSRRQRLTTLTAGSIMPLIMHSLPRQKVERLVREHLLNENEFWTRLPVPSLARCDPAYDPVGERSIWRGPVCMNLNWLLARGLRAHDKDDIADEIARRSREAALNDFREFYSPETGRGMRGAEFGWATVTVDM
jgi:glycogen debranching enzyme